MALIPYEILPGDKDPAILIGTDPVYEGYCGDARCDCVTAHLFYGGVRFTLDLGTANLEIASDPSVAGQDRLHGALSDAVRGEGVLDRLRSHYARAREFGKFNHFQFMNWADLKPNQLLSWQEVFRTDNLASFTMIEGSPPDAPQEPGAQEPSRIQVQLGDSYCVDPKCDCRRVLLQVNVGPQARPAGTVIYDFKTQEPAVFQTAPGTDPNWLFLLVQAIIRGQKGLSQMYVQRYSDLRQVMIPLIAYQRRQKLNPTVAPSGAGRNDPCPCGSGKKFKKCHGA